MSLSRNLVAGMASSIWTAVIGLAVVPLYLKYLGIEAYGLIGFFATIQAVLSLLDMGLAPTINREVARCSASGNMNEARSLLHSLAIVYWAMACMIALAVAGLAPFIAGHWLQSRNLPQETISHAVMLMGLVAACRWPVGLYQGALMGLQKIALSSGVASAIGTLSSLGAISVLAFISPTIEAFFIWQACVGIGYALTIRWITWQSIGSKNQSRQFSFDALKRIWRFSAGMSGVAVTSVILMQLDKVLLSRMLNLDDFGRYVLAGVIANGLYIMLSPLFNAIYPRMTALVASGEKEKLIELYKSGTRLFLALFFPIAIMVAIYSKDLLYLLTRNEHLASSTATIASLLLLGTALNGVMHFPYALQLAYGSTRLPLTITVVLILILAPMIIILTLSYGAIGGASAWFLLNISYLCFGTWITHKELLIGHALDWLIHSVGLPLVVSLLVITLGWQTTHLEGSYFHNLLWGGSFIILALSVNLFLMPKEFLLKLIPEML